MPKTWPLYEAKNKLTQVIDEAVSAGPQTITRRGVETVVVVSVADFKKLIRPQSTLREFFATSPLKGVALELDRRRGKGRGTDRELPH